jgi:hypothetical protein
MTIAVAAIVAIAWISIAGIAWASCALAQKCDAALELLDFDGPLPQSTIAR